MTKIVKTTMSFFILMPKKTLGKSSKCSTKFNQFCFRTDVTLVVWQQLKFDRYLFKSTEGTQLNNDDFK